VAQTSHQRKKCARRTGHLAPRLTHTSRTRAPPTDCGGPQWATRDSIVDRTEVRRGRGPCSNAVRCAADTQTTHHSNADSLIDVTAGAKASRNASNADVSPVARHAPHHTPHHTLAMRAPSSRARFHAQCRASIDILISAMALPGLRCLGQVFEQFMMVLQR